MDYKTSLTKTFMQLDKDLNEYDYSDSEGSTSCVVLITPDKIYCANAGDSRAALSQSAATNTIALSQDHKPTEPVET